MRSGIWSGWRERGMLWICSATVWKLTVSAGCLILSFFMKGRLPVDPAWVPALLLGSGIVKEALEGLFLRFDIKADLLVALALAASLCTGEVFAAGEVAFIMTLGELLEEKTTEKARSGIERLLSLMPVTARLIGAEGERIIAGDQVRKGDLLRVLAGETIPADGVVVRGCGTVDESVITGEPIPVDKAPGARLSSGSVNQFGVLEMEAMADASDSTISRMVRLVKEADAGKSKIVGIADRWATWIVVAALITAGIAWIVTGEALRAVSVLVVFCPCSLVLATPTAIMAAIGNASRHGILIRNGDFFDRMALVDAIAFDKTGTLSAGKPGVAEIFCDESRLPRADFVNFLLSAESRSEHPLGKAVARMEGTHLPVESFELFPGNGIAAEVAGHRVLAGRPVFLKTRGMRENPLVERHASAAAERGETLILAAVDGTVCGFLTLADRLRPDSGRVVNALKEIGLKTLLISGDHEKAVAAAARSCSIDEYHAECTPEEKTRIIAAFQENGKKLCMIGDGVNDAPALKTAFLGISMGGAGSDIAIEASDAVLIHDDLGKIAGLFRLARRTLRTIQWNLSLSMLINFAALFFAVLGLLPPVWGALVHNCGSVAVVLNSTRLLKFPMEKNWRTAPHSPPGE